MILRNSTIEASRFLFFISFFDNLQLKDGNSQISSLKYSQNQQTTVFLTISWMKMVAVGSFGIFFFSFYLLKGEEICSRNSAFKPAIVENGLQLLLSVFLDYRNTRFISVWGTSIFKTNTDWKFVISEKEQTFNNDCHKI